MFLRLAFSNLLRNKRRTLFTEFAIVFGVAVIIFTGSFFKGMFQSWSLMQINQDLGAFQVEHQDFQEKNRLDPLGVTLENSKAIIQEIESLPGIVAAYGELQMTGVVSSGSKSSTFNGKGVDKDGQRRTLSLSEVLLKEGRALGDDPNEVVLGQLLAETLDVKVGAQVAIVVKTLKGSIDMMYSTVVGVKNGNHFPSATYLEINLAQAQKFMRMPDRVTQILVSGESYDDFLGYAQTTESKLQQAGYPIIVRDYTVLITMFTTVKGAFTLISVVIGIILFLIVGGGIANVMFMAVRERRKEIGTMKAIGMEPQQVRLLFILEGLFVGLLGAITGIILAFWLIHIVNAQGGISVVPDLYFNALIDWRVVGIAFVMSFVISTLGSWLPASMSAKLDPVKALTEA